MLTPSRIIDSHQHVFWHGRDDRGLIADMDELGVEYAWLLSWEIPPSEDNPSYHAVLSPRDLLRARDRYPTRFVVGYCPHPAVGKAPSLLAAAAKIHGVQVCGEWKFRIPFDDPRSLELFYAAGELGLPVVLHLDVPYLLKDGKRTYQPNWYGGTVENLERALQACPRTTFIGHAPGFWREISADADTDPAAYPRGPVQGRGRLYDLFDRYPNLLADLSAGSARTALERDPEHAVQFIDRYRDRLLFGRDCYGQDLHRFLSSLSLTSEVLEGIYHRNAEKLIPNTATKAGRQRTTE